MVARKNPAQERLEVELRDLKERCDFDEYAQAVVDSGRALQSYEGEVDQRPLKRLSRYPRF